MKYRPEIDGLRALAVVPVILFHAGFELFGGGFVGVDIFFVISGYLITMILIEELDNGRFSLINFYERRARRILPALFFVMLLCLPFAWMWMLPSQMKDFSQSLVAVGVFASNILFWSESGYFEASSEEKPLLHTWSLAVEEQYYIFFPIFLIFAWRFGKHRVFWMIVVIASISLLLSEWGWRKNLTANFYLIPTRSWELFAGSIAAFVVHKRDVQDNNILALAGLAAIIFSIFVYDKTTPFPSVYALVPVIGAVLLILFAGKQTLTARLLSCKVFVGIGLISYSAYLWHQPLLAFARIWAGDLSKIAMITIPVISMVLAYLSWKFIETPLRNKEKFSRSKIFLISIVGCLTFVALGLLGNYQQGFSERVTFSEVNDAKAKAIAAEWEFNGYPLHPLIEETTSGNYRIGKESDTKLSTVIIGDSHSKQYWYGVADHVNKNLEILEKRNIHLFKVSFDEVFLSGNLTLPPNTDQVVISFFWAYRLNNPNVNTYIRCCGGGPGGVVGKKYIPLNDSVLEEKYSKLDEVLQKLKGDGIEVTLVLDNPFGEELNAKSLMDVKRGLNIAITKNENADVELTKTIALMRREPTSSKLVQLTGKHQINIIDPFDYLCGQVFCNKFSDQGYLLYKDYDHLSLSAIKNEGRYINDIFR